MIVNLIKNQENDKCVRLNENNISIGISFNFNISVENFPNKYSSFFEKYQVTRVKTDIDLYTTIILKSGILF